MANLAEVFDPHLYDEEERLTELDDPIAFKATSDPDTMYMHQAMKEPDAAEVKAAMVKEMQDHTDKDHWEVMEKRDLPEGYKPLPAV